MLDNATLKDLLGKKPLKPAAQSRAVSRVTERHGLRQRHAGRLVGMDCSTVRCQSKRPDDAALRLRLRELGAERRRFGYRRLGWMLAREGHVMNHQRLYRLYHEEKLMVRETRPAQTCAGNPDPAARAARDQPTLAARLRLRHAE